MTTERQSTSRTRGGCAQGRVGWHPGVRLSAGYVSERSEADPGSHSLARLCPDAPPELKRQPPAAPAVTEAASLHPVRWAPHPWAETAPGTEPSPRTPALGTMPPRQKLVDEAPAVQAVSPAADPSSLPVAESVRRREPPLVKNLDLDPQGRLFSGVKGETGMSTAKSGPLRRSLLGEEASILVIRELWQGVPASFGGPVAKRRGLR